LGQIFGGIFFATFLELKVDFGFGVVFSNPRRLSLHATQQVS